MFRVRGSGFRAWGLGFMVSLGFGPGFRAWVYGLKTFG